MRWLRMLALASAVLAAAAPAAAQTQTGEIVGRIVDGSGAALPGTTVTATSPVLLQPLTTQAGDTGGYQLTNLPVGTYAVRFELPGFKTLVREQVQVATGFSAQIHAQLEISSLQETVTVTSESPMINTRQRGTESTFTQDMLQNIPSARDPWVILERAPGITMDRSNVGGTASGQQSGFISRGATTTNNMWAIDGVVVTDLVATGASSIYYDFDSFEEIQISTGGNDASLQTGGVGINLVTKSGTDRFKGTGRTTSPTTSSRPTTSTMRCGRRMRTRATPFSGSRTTGSRPAARSTAAAPGSGAATPNRTSTSASSASTSRRPAVRRRRARRRRRSAPVCSPTRRCSTTTTSRAAARRSAATPRRG